MSVDDFRWEELAVYWDRLGQEEREILLEVAEGLVEGQKKYGGFNLLHTDLDLVGEADAEDRDWLVYRAAAIVQERKRRG